MLPDLLKNCRFWEDAARPSQKLHRNPFALIREKMKTMQLVSFVELQAELEQPIVYKALTTAHRYLAELKGMAKTIPVMISPSLRSLKSATQRLKHSLNCWVSINPKTRPNVSCDGIPCLKSRTLVNHFSLALPNCSIDAQSSAPQITAHSVIKKMSLSLRRSKRGSGIEAKGSSIEAVGRSFIGQPKAWNRTRLRSFCQEHFNAIALVVGYALITWIHHLW